MSGQSRSQPGAPAGHVRAEQEQCERACGRHHRGDTQRGAAAGNRRRRQMDDEGDQHRHHDEGEAEVGDDRPGLEAPVDDVGPQGRLREEQRHDCEPQTQHDTVTPVPQKGGRTHQQGADDRCRHQIPVRHLDDGVVIGGRDQASVAARPARATQPRIRGAHQPAHRHGQQGENGGDQRKPGQLRHRAAASGGCFDAEHLRPVFNAALLRCAPVLAHSTGRIRGRAPRPTKPVRSENLVVWVVWSRR